MDVRGFIRSGSLLSESVATWTWETWELFSTGGDSAPGRRLPHTQAGGSELSPRGHWANPLQSARGGSSACPCLILGDGGPRGQGLQHPALRTPLPMSTQPPVLHEPPCPFFPAQPQFPPLAYRQPMSLPCHKMAMSMCDKRLQGFCLQGQGAFSLTGALERPVVLGSVVAVNSQTELAGP